MRTTILALGLTASLLANPKEATLMVGSASFSEPSSGVLEIATSDIAIINWSDFSISADEVTRFIQPGTLSAVLNRVTGGNPSDLQGQLIANGSVYLINANGVFISPDAIVQTNNFLASTFEINDGDFLAHDFTRGLFYVPPAIHPHDHPYAAAVRHEGQFSALSVEEHGGCFYLLADRVEVSGTVDSPSGQVRIVGDQILLNHTARIDVSGPAPGRIEIGGGPHGLDQSIPNASQVAVISGAALRANSTTDQDGGQIVIWSQDGTWFHGSLEALGGPSGGNGGWIEVSGKHFLDYHGIAATTAPFGAVGTLLLDPINITVTGADSMISGPPIFYPTGSPSTIDAATILTNLGLTDVVVESSGAAGSENGDIIISAVLSYAEINDLTFRTANLSTSPPVPAGNIDINADVINTGTGSIFFEASGSINQTGATVSTFGSLTFDAAGDFNLSASGAVDAGALLGGGTGVLTVNVGNDLVITGTGPGDAEIQSSASLGPIILNIGGNLELICVPGGGAQINAGTGLTANIGGDLLMDQSGTGGACAITLDMGTSDINVGGNAIMNGTAAIDGLSDVGISSIHIGRNLTMLGDANMSQNLDDGFTLNVGGSLLMLGDVIITVSSAGGPLSVTVGGNLIGNGDGDIDAVGATGNFSIQVGGDIQLIDSFNFASFGTDRSLTVDAGRDFIINGTVGEDAGFSLNEGGPIAITVGRDFLMQNEALFDNSSNGSISISAGRTIEVSGTSAFISVGATDITLICDADDSKPPEIGSGQFIKTSGASIDTNGGLLLIYTADRSQNSVQGLLNGVPFIPGPLFVNSATEMWGIYAPHNSGIPFTLFYKNIHVPPSAIAAFDVAYFDFLQNLSRFDRLFFMLKKFDATEKATMVQPLFWQNNPIWFAPSLYLE